METFKTQDGTVITYTNGKVDITKPVGRWKANKDEDFYYIDSFGKIETTFFRNTDCDNYRYNTLNMFKTKGEAAEKIDYDLAIGTLTLAIEELNGGWKPHWNQINTAGRPANFYKDEIKYEIYYDYMRSCYLIAEPRDTQSMMLLPHCKTEAIAQEIIDKYSKELDILRTYQS